MKKRLFVILGICSLFLITGCGKEKEESDNLDLYKDMTTYEIHYYNYNHTENMIAKYDDDGNMMYFEKYEVYPKGTACNEKYENAKDLEYDGVKYECKETDDGVRVSYSLTNKSIEAGYPDAEDKEFNAFLSWYKSYKDEETVKVNIQNTINYVKGMGLECNDQNYFILDGERTCW